jgi:D-glycero-alpha-D-manno-heptose-7-phosphate kinase
VIISRTPFRVSFAGGGTDLRAFYGAEPGAVTSVTIDRYMYITVNRRFDDTLRVSYSRTEIVDDFESLRHPIVRECLRLTGLTRGLEITSIADIPAGTGVGSSSSFTVGLLHALHAFAGRHAAPDLLARQACQIEIDVLGEPIGKQDQYAAAYGGLRHLRFHPDESVSVDPVICPPGTVRELQANLMFFYTGAVRSASEILERQRQNTESKREHLRAMRALAERIRDVLQEGRRLERVGEALHEAWAHKQQLAGGITSPAIDGFYARAREAGALGGKILGAGGGGFLLLYVERPNQPRVEGALRELRRVPLAFENQGSKIIFVGEMG